MPKHHPPLTDSLCRHCAICCSGILFRDVRLTRTDSVPSLRSLGLHIRRRSDAHYLRQPCSALDGDQCQCYTQRPTPCRRFECLLFQKVDAGRITVDKARRIIRQARARGARVERLLEQLGVTEAHLPLAQRFRRLTRRLEDETCDADTARLYGDLTMEMHALEVCLAEWFYPEPKA